MAEWIRGVVTETDLSSACLVLTTPNGSINISLPRKLHPNIHILWKGAEVSCLLHGSEVKHLVLEPEQILDVTEVAECLTAAGDFPSLAILRSLQPRAQSTAALRGSLINAAFDIMVHNSKLSNDEVLQHVLRSKTLALASIGSTDAIIAEIQGAFTGLRSMLARWTPYSIVVEPYVISHTIGLQGRFDIVITDPSTDDVHIVELKSGSAPRASRDNHLAQVSAYALLHELISYNETARCSLWYLSDNVNPLRQIEPDTIAAFQQRLLVTRNQIVAMRQQFARRDFSILKNLNGSTLHGAGIAASFEETFATAYSNADVVSRTATQAWLSWITREHNEVMAGSQQSRSTADLWRKTDVEKSESPTVLLHLRADASKSDPERMHVVLESDKCIDNTALRHGDLVFIHKERPGQEQIDCCAHLVFKGTLQHIDEYGVTISLRNKQVEWDDIFSTMWILEQEVTVSNLRHLTSSLYQFLSAAEQRRLSILGAQPPRFHSLPFVDRGTLTDQQLQIVQQALSCTDWFLVQGPPGTGKTSQVLRAIVSSLVSGTTHSTEKKDNSPAVPTAATSDRSERVLVLAYTNRAVNEICTVLSTVLPEGSFFRHGTSLGIDASLRSVSIPHITDGMAADAVATMIRGAKCIVSTIHAVHSQPEIFAFGKFTTAVVDEASQVLDVQIAGILAQVDRHILIGDHKQLPPVVAQSDESLTVNAPILADIGISSLGTSIFERLALLCERNEWKGAMAMLEHQGRMHRDVMQFASQTFYNHRLKTIAPWQQDQRPLPWSPRIPHRFMFYHCTSVEDEATLAVKIAEFIVSSSQANNEEYSVGIITPFRVQNRRVITLLPENLRTSIMVDTVERFQGSQRDVIIYATSVANLQEFESIQSDLHGVDRKLNVAATRARHQFVMIGNNTVLQASDSYAAAIAMMSE